MKDNRQDSGTLHRCSAVDDIGLMVVIVQASDSTHAAVEFCRHEPDVTLMDFRLPDASCTEKEKQTRTSNERDIFPYASEVLSNHGGESH